MSFFRKTVMKFIPENKKLNMKLPVPYRELAASLSSG